MLAPATILVVDDCPDNRGVMGRLLALEGYRILSASTGGEALCLARQFPDLIVLDIGLPDVNGFDVCRTIRSDPSTACIPVIQLSGKFTAIDDRIQGLEGGADVFLAKPVLPRELVAYARALLRVRSAERSRSKSEARLRAIVETTSEAVLVLSEDGVILEVNPAGLTMLECDRPDQVIGRFIEAFVSPEDRLAVRAFHEGICAGNTGRLEFEVLGQRGTRRRHEAASSALRDPTSEKSSHLAILRDITERKRAEQQIRFQALLLDQVRNAVIATDLKGVVTYMNKFAEALYQYRIEDAIGKSALEVTATDLDVAKSRGIADTIHATGHWEGEFHVKRKDGSTLLAHVSSAFLRDDRGNPLGYLGVTEDVTERMRSEAELRSHKDLLQKIFDHAPVMIGLVEPSGRVVMVNRLFEQITGWTSDEVRRRDVIADLYPDPKDYSRAIDFIREASEGWGDFQLMTKDGRIVETSWATVVLEDGSRIGIGLDVTQRNRMESQRDELYRQVRSSREMLGILSRRLIESQEAERRHLAHELHDEIGQILTTVNVSLEGIKAKSSPLAMARIDECLGIIGRAIEQVRGLSLDLRPASLDTLGLEAAVSAYVMRQADRAGLRARFNGELAGQRLPSMLETVCFRVVQEAITNVVRHAQARHVWVELAVRQGELQVVVQDDGRGFDLVTIRERMKRGEAFGLLSMEERVQPLGGQIEIDSFPGRGATIRADFPLNWQA